MYYGEEIIFFVKLVNLLRILVNNIFVDFIEFIGFMELGVSFFVVICNEV